MTTQHEIFASMFYVDRLSVVMLLLVAFVSLPVALFSKKYMKGDSRYGLFFLRMLLVVLSVGVMAVANNLLVLIVALITCNRQISGLIAHKSHWPAADASRKLAIRYTSFSSAMMYLSLVSLGWPAQRLGGWNPMSAVRVAAETVFMRNWQTILSIQNIIGSSLYPILIGTKPMFIGFVTMIALIQSGVFPFHRWLASSMNAPTPVSALMHAGVVNAGGFLLIRFAPLYLKSPTMLQVIFMVGLINAILGSFLKLIQSDVKRMLVFSTISQTGFMLVQCGLGFFASALAHICWHGMFKACLFLASGNAGAEKRYDFSIRPTFVSLSFSAFCALFNSMLFAFWHQVQWSSWNTNAFVVGIVFIANMQIALTLLGNPPRYHWGRTALVSTSMTAVYSATLYGFDHFLAPLNLMQAQRLTRVHIGGFALLLVSWCLVVYIKSHKHIEKMPHWVLYLYVKALNISQPNPKTITTCRKGYDYV